jgi:hypothetical protein
MNARLCAILIVVCLALAGTGCASIFHGPKAPKHKAQTHKVQKHSQEVLLPRQTGSNLDRRITIDDESSIQETKKKRPESRPPPKKTVKTAPTEPERVEPEKPKKPEKPEQTATPPDRFR